MHKKAKDIGTSAPPPTTPSRIMKNVVKMAQLYNEQTPKDIKDEIEEVE